MGNEKLREALEWALSQASLYPRQVDYMRWECRFCGVEAQKVQGIPMEHSPECPYGKARAALAAEQPEQVRCDYQSVFVNGQCNLEKGHSGLHRIPELAQPATEQPSAEVSLEDLPSGTGGKFKKWS